MRRGLPFFGRQSQIAWFTHRLHEAMAGRPHVVLVPGEMGIGKSRLLTEVHALATQCQMQVCFGHCYEDLTMPYLPFVEALRDPWGQSSGNTTPSMEDDARLLNQFLPFDAASPQVPPASLASGDDQDRLRLFLVLTRTLIRLARRHPLLVVIEDLHWADQPSVDLFEHLAFTIIDTAKQEAVPLLLVGTYRPEEPGARLDRLLSRLHREAIYDTLPLMGLDETEMYALLYSLGLGRPSPQLVATIKELTRGNPLFIHEALQQLRQHEALQERGEQVVLSRAFDALRLPKQLTQAIHTRCLGLSAACREVLTRAAFLGDRFSLATLTAICEANPNMVMSQLEEGLRQHLLLSEGGAFRFAHALIRHVLYHRTNATQRPRLHLYLARTLEALYGDSRDQHALEIAHHLVRAGSVAGSATVAQYARLAGEQAFAMFAWGEAAYYYEAVLAAADAADLLSTHERAEFHYRVGLAQDRNGDIDRCLNHYRQAIEAYRLTGDLEGLAQVLMQQTRVHYRNFVSYDTLVDTQPLEEVFDAVGTSRPKLRGNIATILSQSYWAARRTEKAKEMARHALEIGHQLPDDRLRTRASFALGLAQSQCLHLRQALESFQNALVYAQRANDLWLQNWPLTRTPVVLAQMGRLDEAQTIARGACEVTRRTHDWSNLSQVLSTLVCVNFARGNFKEGETYTHETITMGFRSGYPWGSMRALYARVCARAWHGEWAAAEEALDMLMTPGRAFEQVGMVNQSFPLVFRQLLRAYAGNHDKSMASLVAEVGETTEIDMYTPGPLCAIVEIAACTASPAIAEAPYQVLSQAAERGVLLPSWGLFLIPRVLGVAASLKGWWDKAEVHFRMAIEAATHSGMPPELGRTYLDYARMLKARGSKRDRQHALGLAERAGRILKTLDMTPFAQQAEQLARALQAHTMETSHDQAASRNGHHTEEEKR